MKRCSEISAGPKTAQVVDQCQLQHGRNSHLRVVPTSFWDQLKVLLRITWKGQMAQAPPKRKRRGCLGF